MVGRFFYYLLNVFFTIVPLNMLFRIFPSEKRKSRDVYLASIFYAIFFLWMLPVPTAIASRYTMIFIYPFTAFNMFFFLGGSKSFKFILFCLYFNVLMLIEATSSLILSLIGLLFPGLHITGIFVAFEGNDISISPKGGATKRQPLSMECYVVRIRKKFCRVRKTVVCLF